MPVVLKNNASNSLAAAITSTDTGIVVRNGNLFPALAAGQYFYATITGADGSQEIVKVTARSGNGMTIVRAQEGTFALPFQLDSRFEMRITAATIADILAEDDLAATVTIADAGGYYTGGTVEAALQEVGSILTTVPVARGGTAATTADNALVNLAAQKKFAQVRKDVATLLADTTITYTAGTVNSVTTGDVVQTAAEGFSYSVAASGATNHHVITAGGVKLYVLPASDGMMNILAFGAVGDGVTNDAPAIAKAHATGRLVFYPFRDYLHVGYFPECEGGIVGEGASTNPASLRTRILFSHCTDPLRGALKVKTDQPRSSFFRLENVTLQATSWDSVTGCLGYGLVVAAPVALRNVMVENFKKSNAFFHHKTTSPTSGPYASIIENLQCTRSGEHGCLVGAGANNLTFVNYIGFWNGAPSYGVAPTVPGSFDGFHIANTNDGNSNIGLYNPESLTIIGGDASYNSRYGWNFAGFRESGLVCPGYAEYNLVKEARIGTALRSVRIYFSKLLSGVGSFQNDASFQPYYNTVLVTLGGKKLFPSEDWTMIANPALPDLNSSDQWINAPVSRQLYLSRTDNFAQSTYIVGNSKPDGSAVNPATETVATLRGFGSDAAIGVGSGARHLEIRDNEVILPDLFWQKTVTGWGAAKVRRGMGTAPPGSGTFARGDIIYNTTPSAGGFVGWVCVSAGTPGTWKGFGSIEA